MPSGWAGVHTIGRLLSINEDGILHYKPIEEIKSLRHRHWHFDSQRIDESPGKLLDGVEGDMLEIVADIDPGDSTTCGLILRASPGLEEQTRIVLDRREETLVVDHTQASLDPKVHLHVYRSRPTGKVHGGPFRLRNGEPLSLRIFVDRSIIEVYANDRRCLTSRVYPALAHSIHIGSFASGGTAVMQSLDVWQMDSIWPTNDSED